MDATLPISNRLLKKKAEFGTAPVFLTAISTILGAIMFLRFGYAVGNVSFMGTLVIIIIGHMVTIPTAMAIAEIATNQKVEGGGEYYIISRSFGLTIGATVGLGLFFSQAISVAFYIIAFAQSFDPVIPYISTHNGITIQDNRVFAVPALIILVILVLTKGADLGVKALYVVVSVLFLSLIAFFAGTTDYEKNHDYMVLLNHIKNPDSFFYVFAICFPAFTGMTAGVGLSGDLKDPTKSIPLGTLSATLLGAIIYIAIAFKLSIAAPPEALAHDQLIMSKIAVWGPIIPLGLACATFSSALGSIMVAPRTLQALGGDNVFPIPKINQWLSITKGVNAEPFNATIITSAIAIFFVLIGDVNFVAQIISMFFMVTYGSICMISFLQHFAANPSYRPGFRSRWYISLLGALMCLWLSFMMNAVYAIIALIVITVLYFAIRATIKDKTGLAAIFQGAIFQLSRKIQVFLQKVNKENIDGQWRPSVVCFTEASFDRFALLDLLKWISHRYGFGTYIHFIRGYLSRETHHQSRIVLEKLIKIADLSNGNIYMDTLVSPSFTSAIAQTIQLPGISGKENNMILFEVPKNEMTGIDEILENYNLIRAIDFDVGILVSSSKGYGYRNEIHVWIKSTDYENANLMILLAYIISGHTDWRGNTIKIFALHQEKSLEEQRTYLLDLIREGRLPISPTHIELIAQGSIDNDKTLINEYSADAALTIIGFREELIVATKMDTLMHYDKIGNILFINAAREKKIS